MAIVQRTPQELRDVLEYLDVKKYTGISDKGVVLIGAIIFAIIGSITSLPFPNYKLWIGIINGIIFWLGIYHIWGFTSVNAQDVLIVERFGKFKEAYEAGWHTLCFPGLIDKKIEEAINLRKATSHIRTEDDTDVEIDFNCGSSAPIKGEMWYEIVDPIFWHYRIADKELWLRNQTSAFIQPILEYRTLDEARDEKTAINMLFLELNDTRRNSNGNVICTKCISLRNPDFVTNANANQLVIPFQGTEKLCFHDFAKAQIGIEVTALLLLDIEIPEIIQEIRNTELAAELKRKSSKIDSSGYIESIQTIKSLAEEMGENLSFADAERIYNLNKDREAFEKTGANVNIVGSDIKSMIASFLNGGHR